MKFAPMNYHYLRYPIKKFLDKVERSPFNSIDLYCSAPQLNLFDYPLLRLIELKKEIEAHHLSVMAMTPENCVYPVNFCTQDDLTRESSIRYYQRAIDTAQFLDCPCVQISTGFGYFDQPREEGWKYCRESLWTLAQYCEKKDVRLLLEELKVTTTNVLITSKDIAKMLEEIESPSIVGMVDMDQMTYAKEQKRSKSMLEVNNLFHATRIIEGYGVIETTGQECANLGFGKVLVITDPFLASSEHYKKLKKSLDDAKIENFLLTNVKPNPRAEDCDEMAEFAKKNHVDALIALGGGSAMDQAKAVGAVVTNGKSTVEWGDTELDTNILPLICIPSTSGTGAEVTWCAVITDTERQYKMTVGDPVHMIPVLAICDPEITIGLPKSLTAACGVDALTHCIEAYTVQLHQPITDALALKGISMIAENLEKAYENGEDREARRNMMIASTIGGMAFISSNVGAVHAFAETVGAWFDTPHGVANSLFLPYIMEFNIPACPERFADIADAMGIEREESMSDEQYALKAVEYVKALNRKLNIPTIKEIKGITEERFEAIAERSANNVLSNDNARKITKEDYLELLKKAYNE